MSDLFRLYEPHEAGDDGYPLKWHCLDGGSEYPGGWGLKHIVRARAGDRCLRCGHPYQAGMGEWSRCDEDCDHPGPARSMSRMDAGSMVVLEAWKEAQWRILTVHHLDEDKLNCRWWNLAALCQRDHLEIQRRVKMRRPWPWEHSAWFRPYVAGFYAWHFRGLDLTREETEERMDELLAMGAEESAVERMPL